MRAAWWIGGAWGALALSACRRGPDASGGAYARFVHDGDTRVVDVKSGETRAAVASRYGALTRVASAVPWELRDPIGGRWIVPLADAAGRADLYAVRGPSTAGSGRGRGLMGHFAVPGLPVGV